MTALDQSHPGHPPAAEARSALRMRVTGMTCAGCANRVSESLHKVPGVAEVNVNFATGEALIQAEPNAVDARDLMAAIAAAGYGGRVLARGEVAEAAPDRAQLWPVLLGAACTVPLVAPMVLAPFGVHAELPGWLQFGLAAIVQSVCGGRFYRGAVHALRSLTGTMDLLVAMGTTAAFLLSVYHLFVGGPLYFEASAAIITFVLLGHWLERGARLDATAAVRALGALKPETAWLVEPAGSREVDLAQLQIGDRILLKPGARAPADGVVESGDGEMDEALLTGEPWPIAKSAGDPVIAGALNGDAAITLRVTARPEDSFLDRVLDQMQRAQASKPPLQRLVDRVVVFFVPAVLAIALATFAGWMLAGAGLEAAIINAVSVLVIACPCALGLATPIVVVASVSLAARTGLLVRDAESLERAASVTRIWFDKTGTLTRGEPRIESWAGADEALALAASLQASSDHVLAGAFWAAAEAQQVSWTVADGLRRMPGRGIEASIDGRLLRLGSSRWMRELDVDLSPLGASGEDYARRGLTVVWLADGGRAIAVFGIGDALRPEAVQTVAELKAMRIEPRLLSGDTEAACRSAAESAGISLVRAEATPEDKAEIVQRGRPDAGTTAMVGDGVNDAAALAAAGVGLAIGEGADVAVEIAGIALMRKDLRSVPAAIRIARMTRRKIRQNLIWAFLFNSIAIPAAALGQLSPMIAGGAMALSSLFVVGNAALMLRGKFTKPSGYS